MGTEPIRKTDDMELTMHPSVQKVAEYIQREIAPNERRGVAEALAVAAPAIWGHYPHEQIHPMRIGYVNDEIVE